MSLVRTVLMFLFYPADSGDEILVIMHNKLNKWMPPGGKVEDNETIWEAAVRELGEETGADISLEPYPFSLQDHEVDRRIKCSPIPKEINLIKTEHDLLENHVFVRYVVSSEFRHQNLNSAEGHLITWAKVDDLLNSDMVLPDIKQTIKNLYSYQRN